MSAVRSFGLTLFAIVAVAILVAGWRGGEPWTAAAFVAFFTSRVVRSVIKTPISGVRRRTPAEDAHRFLLVTAAGWLGSGALAVGASLFGEGQEWFYVAPCFLLFGLLHVYFAVRAASLD
ncbi:MAG TPA: hypothetical protein VGH34_22040 [Vicinamibacterales bacterium]